MSNESVAQQEMKRIVSAMEKEIHRQSEPYLRSTAKTIAIMVYNLMSGFHHVTGNTINSVGVALYYKKKLKYIATSSDDINRRPTRVTLHEGERYNLKEYWDGSEFSKGYVGETEGGGFYADDKAQELARGGVTLPRDWAFKVVVAVPYARYLEQEKGANVITEAHDLLRGAGAEVTEITGV